MREITQVLVAAVGLAFLLPLVTVAAFHFDVGIPFIGALFLFVSVLVLVFDRMGEDGAVDGAEE